MDNDVSVGAPEEWRPIPGWHGFYEMNREGVIRSTSSRNPGRIMVQRPTHRSGNSVFLYGKGTPRMHQVAVLYKETWGVPQPRRLTTPIEEASAKEPTQ